MSYGRMRQFLNLFDLILKEMVGLVKTQQNYEAWWWRQHHALGLFLFSWDRGFS